MKLKFEFSLESETKRIKNHYEVFDWLKENQYNEPLMPGKIKFYSSKEEDSLRELENEFDKKGYIQFKNLIKKGFNKKKLLFEEFLQEIFDKEIPEEIIVTLSRYGLGGSYFPPNMVEINIKKHNIEKTISLLFHEIIHLIFEKYVQRYKLSHWEKERTVDLILHYNKNIDVNHWQSTYHGTEKYVDKLFHKYFFQNKKKYFYKIIKNRPKKQNI